MALLELPPRLAGRLAHPKTTVRWRLTLLYSGLFLACGAAVLAITYTLVAHATVPPAYSYSVRGHGHIGQAQSLPGVLSGITRERSPAEIDQLLRSLTGRTVVNVVVRNERISDLHQLLIWSLIALAIMAVVSAVLGWVVAGRVLAPLRTITAATQQISETNLHQRLAMRGRAG